MTVPKEGAVVDRQHAVAKKQYRAHCEGYKKVRKGCPVRIVVAVTTICTILLCFVATDREAVAAPRFLRASKKSCKVLRARGDIDKQDKFGRNALYEECERGNAIAVDLLLRAGAKVNKKDPWGWTPLHVASWNGHVDVVERLILGGGKVEAEDHWKQTPLFLATKKKHRAVCRLLRRAGAQY